MIFNYKIADIVFSADINYRYTFENMQDYRADKDEIPEFALEVTEADIENERVLSPYDVPAYVLEFTALYRKYIYIVMDRYDAFFFHCSAICVDNQAIMFTAQSGTGKSTHRNIWIKNFGDRVTVINDDKPIVRKIDGVFYVYGTPWKGKEGFGENIRVPAKALCFLSRAEQNSIGPIDTISIVSKMLNQTVRPSQPELMGKLLDLIDGFLNQVDCYDLRVNMNDDAAVVAYNGIKGI
ncbi:MAG: hypothetical protein K6F88_03600 [Ruminococcus sp.]|nr:hypothetical protein [Ruminococcus sp.]